MIEVAVDRVSDSCGFAVPTFTFDGDRDVLNRWAARKSDEELVEYRRRKNSTSIDGLSAPYA